MAEVSFELLTPIYPDGSARVRITLLHGTGKRKPQRQEVDEYDLQTFPAYDGSALGVCLTKPDGTVYNVCLNGSQSHCDCPGFTYHGHCKHLETLGELHLRGPILDRQEENAACLDSDCPF